MTARGLTPIERVMRRVVEKPNGCVEFIGGRNVKGYGRIGMRGESPALTHRVAWEAAHGPVPDGLCVLHRCDNPPCVNVMHLFLGTRGDNNRDTVSKQRARNQRKTHCVNGHPFDAANTRVIVTRSGGSGRVCRACALAADRRREPRDRSRA